MILSVPFAYLACGMPLCRLCENGAGADGVHSNPVGPAINGSAARESEDGSFCGTVGAHARLSDKGGNGPEVDDGASRCSDRRSVGGEIKMQTGPCSVIPLLTNTYTPRSSFHASWWLS
jgi:hypothetical protein